MRNRRCSTPPPRTAPARRACSPRGKNVAADVTLGLRGDTETAASPAQAEHVVETEVGSGGTPACRWSPTVRLAREGPAHRRCRSWDDPRSTVFKRDLLAAHVGYGRGTDQRAAIDARRRVGVAASSTRRTPGGRGCATRWDGGQMGRGPARAPVAATTPGISRHRVNAALDPRCRTPPGREVVIFYSYCQRSLRKSARTQVHRGERAEGWTPHDASQAPTGCPHLPRPESGHCFTKHRTPCGTTGRQAVRGPTARAQLLDAVAARPAGIGRIELSRRQLLGPGRELPHRRPRPRSAPTWCWTPGIPRAAGAAAAEIEQARLPRSVQRGRDGRDAGALFFSRDSVRRVYWRSAGSGARDADLSRSARTGEGGCCYGGKSDGAGHRDGASHQIAADDVGAQQKAGGRGQRGHRPARRDGKGSVPTGRR